MSLKTSKLEEIWVKDIKPSLTYDQASLIVNETSVTYFVIYLEDSNFRASKLILLLVLNLSWLFSSSLVLTIS